jgi:hypothetical protein
MRTPLAPALCLLAFFLLVPLAAAAEGQLPAPTGALGIGLSIFDWTDDSRLETQSEKGGAHRELLVYLFYRIDKKTSGQLQIAFSLAATRR